MTAPRIVFMGTPAFAVPTLNALVMAGLPVVGVVTAPDRPAGRGRHLRPSAVKERAMELGLPVLQPERLKDPDFLAELERLAPDLQVVVAFRMLPEVVWARPSSGTINLHASLLPDYRGAAPINWAIIRGERETGLTTFLISHEIDTGDILLQERMSIGPDETAGELHDRMMMAGAELVVRTVHGLAQGTLPSVPQDHSRAIHDAPKIGPDTCHIDVNCSAKEVHDLVRGMSPHPGAWCLWKEEGRTPAHFKVLRTRLTGVACDQPAGMVSITSKKLLFACADQWLEATEVQPEGKRRMQAEEFIRGLHQRNTITLE